MKLCRKGIRGKLGLSAAAIVTTLIFLEATLRLFGVANTSRQVVRVADPSQEFHPLLGWQSVPNFWGHHKSAEFCVLMRYNSAGFRGPEFPVERKPNEYRVLILGDSFAEGYGVAYEDTAGQVLERELGKGGDQRVTVICAGTSGYSTDQELLLFRTRGLKYVPDLVVLLFCANDIWYNIRDTQNGKPKPQFGIRHGRLTLLNVPLTGPCAQNSAQRGDGGVGRLLVDRLRICRFAYDRATSIPSLRRLSIRLGLTEAPLLQSGERIVLVPPEWRVLEREPVPLIRTAWRATEVLLKALHSQVSEEARLAVLYVPPREAVVPARWEAMKRQFDITEEKWDVHQVAKTLSQICQRHAIDFIDPTSWFQAVAMSTDSSGRELYYKLDRHWNANGHRLAGAIMAEYVTRLLREGGASG